MFDQSELEYLRDAVLTTIEAIEATRPSEDYDPLCLDEEYEEVLAEIATYQALFEKIDELLNE